nr:hypothetical protein [Tanacetum cinerariifolium]
QRLEESLGRQLLDVDHALHVPLATGHQQGSRHRRHAGGVGDALAVGLGESLLVVGHVIDEHFAWLTVSGALDQVADAGLADVAWRQRGRVRQHGLDHLERHHLQTFGGGDRLLGKQAEVLQHREHIDVVLAEAHPEAHVGHVEVLRQRVHFIVAGQVQVLRADHRQVVGALDLEHAVAGPLAVLPAPDLPGELAKVDFRVEVGGEILAVGTGIDVENVDRINAVEMVLLRERGIGIDHARVETDAKDRGDVLLLAFL